MGKALELLNVELIINIDLPSLGHLPEELARHPPSDPLDHRDRKYAFSSSWGS